MDRASPPGGFGRRAAGALAAAVLAAVLAVRPAAAAPPPAGFADLVDRLLPAVVNISTTQIPAAGRDGGESRRRAPSRDLEELFRQFFDRFPDRQRPTSSLGSGFIVSASGYIVTNDHVIDDADEITVTLQDETRFTARVAGRDAKSDLALLKIETERELPTVAFGDSSRLRVGDWVLAIGNPFGLGGTVTAGIVSGRKRDITERVYTDFLQTDASINQGNSGGPMFNVAGEVVGINTAILAPGGHSVGVGFAIPSNLARPILGQLEEFGKARRGWLGVQIQVVTEEIARELGLSEASGALVAALTAGAPAAKHGVEVGDVILRFDGEDVGKMQQLPRLVAGIPAGRSVELEIWRKGAPHKLSVVLGEFPDDEEAALAGGAAGPGPENVKVGKLGFTVSGLTPELRRRFDLDSDVEGVVVTAVDKNGPAARKAILPGTIIRKIGPAYRTVRAPAEVAAAAREADETDESSLLLLVESGGTQRFVVLEIDRG